MINKRLAGVITVKDGWAVQSFGFGSYLPLGRPEVLAENLDRWGVDEIILQCIDRGDLGPDLELLGRVSWGGLSTPVIYAGGIRTEKDGRAAVKAGAERIGVDALLHDSPQTLVDLAGCLGAQALVAMLPVSCAGEGAELAWLDYRSGNEQPLTAELKQLFQDGLISEAMLIDWRHEGSPNAFDARLLDAFPLGNIPLIAFGGLSEAAQLKAALAHRRVVAVAVGNFLSYGEHAIGKYKQQLKESPLRPHVV